MPADMKEAIAEAAMRLLTEKNTKKLTVKDIVEECHITRQAFYYHFEDIPALFRWMLEKGTQTHLEKLRLVDDPEQRLRQFFLMAVQVSPYIKKGLQSNYGTELEQLLTQYLYRLFEQIIDQEGLFQSCTRQQISFLLRYHTHAIMGLFREWTDNDTKNLDQIIHLTHLLATGEITL